MEKIKADLKRYQGERDELMKMAKSYRRVLPQELVIDPNMIKYMDAINLLMGRKARVERLKTMIEMIDYYDIREGHTIDS